MTTFILRVKSRFQEIFNCLFRNHSPCNPDDEKVLHSLKKKVIKEKKNDVRQIRKTNQTLKVLLEKGEFQVRIIRDKK